MDKTLVLNIEAADIVSDINKQKTYKRRQSLPQENTNLSSYLIPCVDARLMLKANIDVHEGLTNGAMGTVTGIINGRKPLGQPEAICVLFDDVKIGVLSRQKMKPPSNADQNSTVVQVHRDVIQRKPVQVTRHQFPFILSWAVTIHKVQGMTTSEAVISLDKIFKPGMAYVALSRVTSLQGLHLQNFNPRSIYCDPVVERVLNAMTSASTLPFWQVLVAPPLEEQHLLIASHNTEGFLPHVQDIECNHFLHKADIFGLQETWLLSDCNTKKCLPHHLYLYL